MTSSELVSAVSAFISLAALVTSYVALRRSDRLRQADSFARLYDEFNSSQFGAAMEHVGAWLSKVASEKCLNRSQLTDEDVRVAYRTYYEPLYKSGANSKNDPLESARRTVKAWFIKCLLNHEADDLSHQQMRSLITRDRANLMLSVFAMTREQTDVWKEKPHDPSSRNSSDEEYFLRLEKLGESA